MYARREDSCLREGDNTYHGLQKTSSGPGGRGAIGTACASDTSECASNTPDQAADGIELALLHVDRCCQHGGGKGGDESELGIHFV